MVCFRVPTTTADAVFDHHHVSLTRCHPPFIIHMELTIMANTPLPATPTYWLGNPPECCQMTGQPFNGVMYDARMYNGHWALVCQDAYELYGSRGDKGQLLIGIGYGQKYELQPDDRWLRVL
jgi:hypothetical protein